MHNVHEPWNKDNDLDLPTEVAWTKETAEKKTKITKINC